MIADVIDFDRTSGMTGRMSAPDLTGLQLPDVFPPVGTYLSARLHDGVLYTAGHIPLGADGTLITGRLGDALTIEEGAHAARLAALSLLATVQQELGSLDRVDRFLYVYGVVNAAPHFTAHTTVIDGASDVFVQVFGERGAHARLAVGVSSLPADVAVEVQATIGRSAALTYPAAMTDLASVAPAFVAMAHRIVWCTVATTSADGRPARASCTRSGSGTAAPSPGGSRPPALTKANDLATQPVVSLTYWEPTHDTCTADMRHRRGRPPRRSGPRVGTGSLTVRRRSGTTPSIIPRMGRADVARVRHPAPHAPSPARDAGLGAARRRGSTSSPGAPDQPSAGSVGRPHVTASRTAAGRESTSARSGRAPSASLTAEKAMRRLMKQVRATICRVVEAGLSQCLDIGGGGGVRVSAHLASPPRQHPLRRVEPLIVAVQDADRDVVARRLRQLPAPRQ